VYISRAVSKPVREVLIVYAIVCALTFAITRLRSIPGWAEWVHLLVGGMFLIFAVKLAQREPAGVRGGSHEGFGGGAPDVISGMQRHGIDLAGVLGPPEGSNDSLFTSVRKAIPSALKETGIALAVAAVVFPPFAIGFWWWIGLPSRPFSFGVPEDFGSFALAQLLVVGLPEESLFRGWFQTRLTDAFPKTVKILWVPLSPPAWIAQAVLFAVVHYVVDFNPAKLAVFFPGLLFGWMRGWRGGIGASILFHAMCNVYADLLKHGWTS
jgi:membrane protease YdiL (CAAX protease family)